MKTPAPFSSFFSDPARIRLVIYVLVFFLVLGLGFYGFFFYQKTQEEKIALVVDEIFDQKSQLVREKQTTETSSLETYQTKLVEIGQDFYRVYQDNTGFSGGLRALFLSAGIDYELEQDKEAIRKYQLLFETDSTHFLAPLSLYYLIVLNENLENYPEAISLAKQFRMLYLGHYLEGEVLLNLARNYFFSGQEEELDKIYQEILEDKRLEPFYDVVREWKNLIKIEKKINQNLDGKSLTKK